MLHQDTKLEEPLISINLVMLYPQVFQYDNWSEFRSGVTMLLKKHDADI